MENTIVEIAEQEIKNLIDVILVRENPTEIQSVYISNETEILNSDDEIRRFTLFLRKRKNAK